MTDCPRKTATTTIVLPHRHATDLGASLDALFQPKMDAIFADLLAAIDVADAALRPIA